MADFEPLDHQVFQDPSRTIGGSDVDGTAGHTLSEVGVSDEAGDQRDFSLSIDELAIAVTVDQRDSGATALKNFPGSIIVHTLFAVPDVDRVRVLPVCILNTVEIHCFEVEGDTLTMDGPSGDTILGSEHNAFSINVKDRTAG